MKEQLLLGAHMSIEGGLYKAIERGESIGCTTIQLFTQSNRQWNTKKLTQENISQFRNSAQKNSIAPLVSHASYLINLGSPKKDVQKKSYIALQQEIIRCENLCIPYLVLHPGSALDSSESKCIDLITSQINTLFKETPGSTIILLETAAGQGTTVGYTFEQLENIRKNIVNKKRIGICLDTCHIFAAGYTFSTPSTYQKMWKQFDKIIGMKNLKVIHINDSKKECGSRIDRHENIGEGKIGLEAFKLIMRDKNLFYIPKILETPKTSLVDDVKNMNILIDLIYTNRKK